MDVLFAMMDLISPIFLVNFLAKIAIHVKQLDKKFTHNAQLQPMLFVNVLLDFLVMALPAQVAHLDLLLAPRLDKRLVKPAMHAMDLGKKLIQNARLRQMQFANAHRDLQVINLLVHSAHQD